MMALAGYREAPYKETLFLDSDAYPCYGFEKLFRVLSPPPTNDAKYWQLPVHKTGDFAAGIEQFPMGAGTPLSWWRPGNDTAKLRDYDHFAERNTGTVMFNFHRELAHTFAEFIPLVGEYLYGNVSNPAEGIEVPHDQCPVRIALYVFKRFIPDLVDQQLPMHSSCRSYPNIEAGTDGFENGMFPRLPDGSYCSECWCTPCRIAHTPSYPIYLHDKFMGWETV